MSSPTFHCYQPTRPSWYSPPCQTLRRFAKHASPTAEVQNTLLHRDVTLKQIPAGQETAGLLSLPPTGRSLNVHLLPLISFYSWQWGREHTGVTAENPDNRFRCRPFSSSHVIWLLMLHSLPHRTSGSVQKAWEDVGKEMGCKSKHC
jgi:hypothetical protein